MLNKFMKNKKGFTLIELVVVVAILGVLALLIVPNVTNRISEAKEAVLEANIKVINNAIKLYYAMEGNYPTLKKTDDDGKLGEIIEVLQAGKYLDAEEAERATEALEGKVSVKEDKDSNKNVIALYLVKK